jgi:hypothetical protein
MLKHRPIHYEPPACIHGQTLPAAPLTGAASTAISRFHLWMRPKGSIQ